MDFSQFDNRGPAETGQRLELLDPTVRKGQPLMSGDRPCVVIVRGSTARSVQIEMRKRQKAKLTAKNRSDEARVMEDVHAEQIAAATPLIVGFENVEREGVPLTASPEDIRWFLDLTFPIMGIKEDEDGDPILTAEGAVQFQMRNNPFARQITEFSAEQAMRLGNGAAS